MNATSELEHFIASMRPSRTPEILEMVAIPSAWVPSGVRRAASPAACEQLVCKKAFVAVIC